MTQRDRFWAAVSPAIFRDGVSPEQVEGTDTILDGWERWFPQGDPRWLAYALATAYHETAATMQPIAEIGRGAGRPYGRAHPDTGHAYYGRGYVQLTWRENYARAGRLVGVDLVADPDAAMEPETAAAILLLGMARGLFTGRRFADYFNTEREDWIRARRIVNGLDRAEAIAVYGRTFDAALLVAAC